MSTIQRSNVNTLVRLAVFVLNSILSYAKFIPLTNVVFVCVIMVMLVVAFFNIDISFLLPAFNEVSFLNPKYAKDNFNINEDDIIQLFLFASFIFWALVSLIQFLSIRIFKKDIVLSWHSKKKVLLTFITTLSAITFVLTLYAGQHDSSAWDTFFAYLFMFTILLVSSYLYLGVDYVQKGLNKKMNQMTN